MSRNRKTVILSASPLLAMTLATTVFFLNRVATEYFLITKQGPDQVRPASRVRNLSLQPEAARVNRRLGKRFSDSGRPELFLTGTLTVGTNQQDLTLIRRQTDEGESVEVQLPARRFTWISSEGIKAVSGLASPSEKLLVERLVFDSPDQFVLAQLRGASYFTITKHLRPNDAGDDYSGPLWTVVRVSEPPQIDDTAPKSRWRLYYVNESTDLIDCIASELNDQPVEDSIEWREWRGDPAPSKVKWTTNRQTIMELEVQAFSRNK